jgi:hypothetical protein
MHPILPFGKYVKTFLLGIRPGIVSAGQEQLVIKDMKVITYIKKNFTTMFEVSFQALVLLHPLPFPVP